MKKFPTFLKAASSHLVTIGWLLPPGTAAGVAKAWRAIPSIPQQTVPKRAKTARTAKPIYRRAARPLSRENHSTCIQSFRTPSISLHPPHFFLRTSNIIHRPSSFLLPLSLARCPGRNPTRADGKQLPTRGPRRRRETPMGPKAPPTLRPKSGKQPGTTWNATGNDFSKQDKARQDLFSWIRKVRPVTGAPCTGHPSPGTSGCKWGQGTRNRGAGRKDLCCGLSFKSFELCSRRPERWRRHRMNRGLFSRICPTLSCLSSFQEVVSSCFASCLGLFSKSPPGASTASSGSAGYRCWGRRGGATSRRESPGHR